MGAIYQKLTVYAGDLQRFTITVTTDGTTAKSLNQGSVTFSVRNGDASGTELFQKTATNGVAINAGVLTVQLDAADTTGLSGPYYMECRAVDSDGVSKVVMEGVLIVVKSGT